MKKLLVIVGLVAACVLSARAGFDQYNSKNYTTILAPSLVNASVVTNATAVDISGLPGIGAIVFAYKCDNVSAASLSFGLETASTSNGTYTVYTNSDGVSAWAYTNGTAYGKVLFKPGSVSKFIRARVTPTSCTNAVAGVILVTE